VKPFLVVNPAVGDFECAFTKARGDGVRLAREALAAGGKLVVAVGGDGTASEVIDGLTGDAGPRDPEALFGFIPRGTGGDLRRTVGIEADVEGAARALASPYVAVLDLGRIELAGRDGTRQVRHFGNVAGLGISGRVSREVNRGLKLPSGKLSFMLATAKALLSWSDQPVRWRVDEGPWQEERLTALSVCNGRYFGGGMLVAPGARMDDGLFDVVVWKELGLADFVTKKKKLYDGTHVDLPGTRVVRARTVEAEPVGDAEVLLDVDGEAPGLLPARFTILPGALRIRVGR
jgi:YegS/Rv2252/BmrU family lipid kinase